jgi:5-(carboxyamino)imidazole ribonucleotide synthase
MADQILPPATIGMLGGGQLGKYALVAANAMGYRTIVVDPDAGAPALIALPSA